MPVYRSSFAVFFMPLYRVFRSFEGCLTPAVSNSDLIPLFEFTISLIFGYCLKSLLCPLMAYWGSSIFINIHQFSTKYMFMSLLLPVKWGRWLLPHLSFVCSGAVRYCRCRANALDVLVTFGLPMYSTIFPFSLSRNSLTQLPTCKTPCHDVDQ